MYIYICVCVNCWGICIPSKIIQECWIASTTWPVTHLNHLTCPAGSLRAKSWVHRQCQRTQEELVGFPKIWSQLKSHQAPQGWLASVCKDVTKTYIESIPVKLLEIYHRKILGNKKFSIQSVASCQLPTRLLRWPQESFLLPEPPRAARNRGRYAWPRITSQRFGADPPIGPIDFQYRNSHCVVDWGHPGVIPLCSSRWDLRSHSQSSQPHATPAFSANAWCKRSGEYASLLGMHVGVN